MFFRLQRLSVYFAKLLESKAHPLWGFDYPIDPRAFAREVITPAGTTPVHDYQGYFSRIEKSTVVFQAAIRKEDQGLHN